MLASLLIATALAAVPTPATSAPAVPPAADTLLAIPPELHHLLQQRVVRRSQSEPERLQRLVALMFDPDGLALQYGTSDTHSVADSYATRRINCLSFTLMFVALARDVGLDARRRGPRTISDRRLFAHYYNNRAAELMAEGHDNEARAYFQMSLRSDPTLADTWNNLGLLDARTDALTTAAGDYDRALALESQHVAALGNALNLFRRLGDEVRAEILLARLQQVHARDPFHQYTLGIEAERSGHYADAARYYTDAIRLYPGAHQFHFGLARVAFLSGNLALADRELRTASSLGPPDELQRYQAKLDGLRRLSRQTASIRP